MPLQKQVRRLPRWLKIVLGIGGLGLAVVCSGLAIISFWPDVAAQNIDRLRDIIGDAPVAQLEEAVLSIQDHIQQVEYQAGLVQPVAPWTVPRVDPATELPTTTKLTNGLSAALGITQTKPTNTPIDTLRPSSTNTPQPSPTPTFTATHTTATCAIGVSTSNGHATNNVSFAANVNHDERDDIIAYAWFVNGTLAGASSNLTYTFVAPGRYSVMVTVTMKSGQSPSCEITVDGAAPPTSTGTFTPLPTNTPTLTRTFTPTNTLSNTFTPSSTVPTNTPTGLDQVLNVSTTQPPSPPAGVSVGTPSTSSLPAWQLSSLTPLGKLAGEGQWSPYLYAADGQTTVAYRTFLQPDRLRPYSIPAIVAFDLQATRLHFVLGTVEPLSATPQPSRTGAIPPADLQPGVLLATFNGGFKARHGYYGAMADGLIALPAINGLATVAIYADGHVQIGEWGTDIKDSPDLVAWRQNGEMLIHNGQINPATARTTVSWGLTLKGDAITWRSALGLSADGRTLYYVAGLHVDVATLTKVMAQAGATEALQLDVNDFWVHFAAIRSVGSSLVAEPLLAEMKLQADRYLKSYSRDFFYVTTAIKH